MKLATLESGSAPCVLVGDALVLFAAAAELGLDALPASIRAVFAPDDGLERVGALAQAAAAPGALAGLREAGLAVATAGARLLAPIPDPRIIFCAGNNYSSHSDEMGVARPSRPSGFFKPPTAVIGAGRAIELPVQAPGMVDYEAELCVVFGRRAYRVDASEAFAYVAGYTCANDVSARDDVPAFLSWLKAPASVAFDPLVDPGAVMLLGKLFPTFMPLGPYLATRDEIADPEALRIRTRVNGITLQDASTSGLTFKIAELIAYWSQYFAFDAGDVLSTGSPPGVGFAKEPPVFLRAGDVVEVEIEGLGILANPVSDAGRSNRA